MLKKISLAIADFYQEYIRMVFPCCCRFFPSCSQYAREAILKYGFWRGCAKGITRLLHCHPYSTRQGYDPLI